MDKPTPPAAGAQQRELQEPTERSRPVPLLVAAITVLMVLLAVAYLLLSDPPGQTRLGDRRSLADLRGPATGGAAGGTASVDGKAVFAANCVACHQATGKGLPGVFPPLDGSEWVNGDARVLANIVLHGVNGAISVAGASFNGSMPNFDRLSDTELAAVLSHVRASWSNHADAITPDLVAAQRAAKLHDKPFNGGDELSQLFKPGT